MAPEQIRGLEVDSRADVWALASCSTRCSRVAGPGTATPLGDDGRDPDLGARADGDAAVRHAARVERPGGVGAGEGQSCRAVTMAMPRGSSPRARGNSRRRSARANRRRRRHVLVAAAMLFAASGVDRWLAPLSRVQGQMGQGNGTPENRQVDPGGTIRGARSIWPTRQRGTSRQTLSCSSSAPT